MLKGYHSINIEGEGLSFLFEFTEDSTVMERNLFVTELRGLYITPYANLEYFDAVKNVWVVNVRFRHGTLRVGNRRRRVVNNAQIQGIRIQVGRAIARLGYKLERKVKR